MCKALSSDIVYSCICPHFRFSAQFISTSPNTEGMFCACLSSWDLRRTGTSRQGLDTERNPLLEVVSPFCLRDYTPSSYPTEVSSLCHLGWPVYELPAKKPWTQKLHHLPQVPKSSYPNPQPPTTEKPVLPRRPALKVSPKEPLTAME